MARNMLKRGKYCTFIAPMPTHINNNKICKKCTAIACFNGLCKNHRNEYFREYRAKRRQRGDIQKQVIELSTALDWREFNNKDAFKIFCSIARQQLGSLGDDTLYPAIDPGKAFLAFRDWLQEFPQGDDIPTDPFEDKKSIFDPEQ